MIFETFLNMHGISITVKREGEEDRIIRGLLNQDQTTGKEYVGFRPGTDIKVGDLMVTPAGDRMFVSDVKTNFFRGKPEELTAYYQTEAERNAAKSAPTIVNIGGNAYGVAVGNGNSAIINYAASIQTIKEEAVKTSPADQAVIERIVALLEMVVNNQVPPSKGLFSKFSDVMERHSWLSSAVASTILGWLMNSI